MILHLGRLGSNTGHVSGRSVQIRTSYRKNSLGIEVPIILRRSVPYAMREGRQEVSAWSHLGCPRGVERVSTVDGTEKDRWGVWCHRAWKKRRRASVLPRKSIRKRGRNIFLEKGFLRWGGGSCFFDGRARWSQGTGLKKLGENERWARLRG